MLEKGLAARCSPSNLHLTRNPGPAGQRHRAGSSATWHCSTLTDQCCPQSIAVAVTALICQLALGPFAAVMMLARLGQAAGDEACEDQANRHPLLRQQRIGIEDHAAQDVEEFAA